MVFTLNAENRNINVKPKQLRKNGIIPGVLYGKDLQDALSIQFSQAETKRFLKSNSAGSKAELAIGGKKIPALLREATFKPATNELEHLSFQTLPAGEIVTSTARIVLVNKEKDSGVVQQLQSEISYRALPAYLVEKIEIDLNGINVGDSIRISDLDIAKNQNIEILSPLDAMVFSVTENREPIETPEAADEAPNTEGE